MSDLETEPLHESDTAASASHRTTNDSVTAVNTCSKAVQKAKSASQAALTQPLTQMLSGKIQELESATLSGTSAEKDAARNRKKQLREVLKFVSDKTNGLEERVAYLQNKFSLQVTELIKTEKLLLESQQQAEAAKRERDRAQAELRRVNPLRDKLEELCRSLQKENKEVAEETRRRTMHEAAQRLALQEKFSQAINDVNAKMDQQASERAKQLAENEALREKLNSFISQFELSEKHHQQQLHAKDLEVKLVQAKLDQALHINGELEKRSQLLAQGTEEVRQQASAMMSLRDQNLELAATNRTLKEQLDAYHGKFEEFQGTLNKSNQVFEKLRSDMDTNRRQQQVLQRERDEARRRADKSDKKVLLLLEDQALLKRKLAAQQPDDAAEVARLRSQKEALEGLCRTLQIRLKSGGGAGAGAAAEDALEAAAASEGASGSSCAASGTDLEGAQQGRLEGCESSGSVGADAGWVKVEDEVVVGAGIAAAPSSADGAAMS